MDSATRHPMADDLTRAVVTVGDGRGFVVQGPDVLGRLVITAAHCLPNLPPALAASYTSERTYTNLLGPRGHEPAVWAECLFVDPVSDVAVLGAPDNQELFDQADAYERLVENAVTLPIADVPSDGRAWLLSLDGEWFRCDVQQFPRSLDVSKAVRGIKGGMSGSPIVRHDGGAVGLIVVAGGHLGTEIHTEGGPNPRLLHALPGWLLGGRR